MGDFNLPVVGWGDTLTSRELYSNLLRSYLYHHVDNPTRDNNLILSTAENVVNDINVGPIFSISDHCIITCNIIIKASPAKDGKKKILDNQRVNLPRLH